MARWFRLAVVARTRAARRGSNMASSSIRRNTSSSMSPACDCCSSDRPVDTNSSAYAAHIYLTRFSLGVRHRRILSKMITKRLEIRKHRAAGCSKAEPKIFAPTQIPFSGAQDGRLKFNQLEMVTTFTYRPSLVKIDARNFELSW